MCVNETNVHTAPWPCLNRRAPGFQFRYAAIRDEANVSPSIPFLAYLFLKKYFLKSRGYSSNPHECDVVKLVK